MKRDKVLLKNEYDVSATKMFVDTPKGKMWFDVDALKNEQKWLNDKNDW